MISVRALSHSIYHVLDISHPFLFVKDYPRATSNSSVPRYSGFSSLHNVMHVYSWSVLRLFHTFLCMFFFTSILIMKKIDCIEACIFLTLLVSTSTCDSLCLERIVAHFLNFVGGISISIHNLHGSDCIPYPEIIFPEERETGIFEILFVFIKF